MAKAFLSPSLLGPWFVPSLVAFALCAACSSDTRPIKVDVDAGPKDSDSGGTPSGEKDGGKVPTAKPDAGPPAPKDAAVVGCTAAADCKAPAPQCDTSTGDCVACIADENCSDETKPYCDPTSHVCGACAMSGQCGGATPYCDPEALVCSACLTDTNCGDPALGCDPATHVCVRLCKDSGDCAQPLPFCDETAGVCVECVGNANCASGACDTDKHVCVECVDDTTCSGLGSTPYCDVDNHKCVECVGAGNCAASAPADTCVEGKCVCPDNGTLCGGGSTCVDTQADDANCGACGNPCAGGKSCVAGVCRVTCTPNPPTDPSGDGDCPGAPTPYCIGGVCAECKGDGNCLAPTPACNATTNTCVQCNDTADCSNPMHVCASHLCACPAGTVQCGSDCVNIVTDTANCGGCGDTCPAGTMCNSGQCQCPNPNELACGGSCIDPSTDFDHCGGCGNRCDSRYESACLGGICQCKAGLTQCGGQCHDLNNDPDRCGACNGAGAVCGDREYCLNGQCECRPGLTLCGGNCVDTKSNPDFCGGCIASGGTVCGMNQKCENGACAAVGGGCSTPDQCPAGSGRAACVDQDVDPLHCGGCAPGDICKNDEVCANGNCEQYAPALTCNTCPCAAVCNDAFGGGTACCDPFAATGGAPICVDNINVGDCP